MNAVIEFPVDRVSRRPPATRILHPEVLIFTGVQVERREFTKPERRRIASTATAKAAEPS